MKFFLPLFLLFSFAAFCQNENSKKDLLTTFDSIIGLKNTDLSYGTIYTKKYRTLENNHQFFKSANFVIGQITYQNQEFYDVLLKYDLAEDQILLNLSSTFENRSIILEKSFVTSFSIANAFFINTDEYGFCEILEKTNSIELLKKNVKDKKKKVNKSFVYYSFLENNSFILKYKKEYYPISNKKDFYELFPINKKTIATFYKANSRLRKNNLDQFYTLLVSIISKEISNQ